MGKGVKLGDKNRIVCWYKLKDAKDPTTYRVLYGDLSVKDVAPKDLPLPSRAVMPVFGPAIDSCVLLMLCVKTDGPSASATSTAALIAADSRRDLTDTRIARELPVPPMLVVQ